jgi:hypothetical protein
VTQSHLSQVPVAHGNYPSYSGGRDQEDQGSKPARVNSLQNPILKIPNTKKGWVAQGVGPEYKTQYHKKKKSYNQKKYFLPSE